MMKSNVCTAIGAWGRSTQAAPSKHRDSVHLGFMLTEKKRQFVKKDNIFIVISVSIFIELEAI